MDDTNDNSHLHLVGIGKNQGIVGTMPAWIQTERIDMAVVNSGYRFIAL